MLFTLQEKRINVKVNDTGIVGQGKYRDYPEKCFITKLTVIEIISNRERGWNSLGKR